VNFGFTEVRLGVAPAVISVVCLPKLRRADALQLFLTGERVPAERAAAIGLITSAVPRLSWTTPGRDCGQPARRRSERFGCEQAPGVRRRKGASGPASSPARVNSAELFASEEAAEGIAAFREKRAPAWLPLYRRADAQHY